MSKVNKYEAQVNYNDFLKKIKLIIWDLDETFWKGTLSEGKITIPESHKKLIVDMVDTGVISSICSKNDYENVENILNENKLNDLFVFKSIDWTAKGYRIKNIVDDMHLRFENVLFIDDNPSNLGEVLHVCPGIMVSNVDIIPKLCEYFSSTEKKDTERKRLKQYVILEEKTKKQKQSGSLGEFLLKSNIRVEFGSDCIDNIDRIVDLVARSNQLNFTKKRDSKEKLIELFNDPNTNCGYVSVSDNYGDYGITGFYAIKKNKAIHFTFSCRTLGMGIEQYVYKAIGEPIVEVIGEVVSELTTPTVTWINVGEKNDNTTKQADIEKQLVVHGPCDLGQIFSFIKESPNIITEFNYVNDKGVSIEQRNCTTHIKEYISFDESIQTNPIITKLPFYDKDMYKTAIFDKNNAFVLISLFTDPCLAMYREKETGLIVSFSEYWYDLTDESRWNEYLGKKNYLHNCVFTKEDLIHLKNNFEYIGRIQPNEVVENIDYIYNHLCKDCCLILTLQSETPFKSTNKNYQFSGVMPKKADVFERHVYNKLLNDKLREWAKGKKNIHFLDFNKYITGPESFTDHISHFTRDVYYKMSCELVEIIQSSSDIDFSSKNKTLADTKESILKIKYRLCSIRDRIKNKYFKK